SGGEARMMPVSPPNKNVTRNPSANSIGVSNVMDPRHMVPIHAKNFRPVGMAISIVVAAKNGRLTAPVTYMWWAHTEIDSAAMASVANTGPLQPNSGLRLDTVMTSVMMPKNGKAMM